MHYTQRWLPTLLVYCSLSTVVLSLWFVGVRLGITTDYQTLFINLSLALFILHTPYFLALYLRKKMVSSWASVPLITFLLLLGLSCFGFLLGDDGLLSSGIIISIGWYLTIKNWLAWMPNVRHRSHQISLPLWLFFSSYLATRIWGIGYLSPLFDVQLMTAAAHPDSLFHIAIANMIRTYGVPSSGVDGLVFLPYHFGSHWLLAGLANLTATPMDLFYHFSYPVIFLPLICFCLLFVTHEIQRHVAKPQLFLTNQVRFWLVFILGFTGLVPLFIQNRSQTEVIFFQSESYTVGMVMSLLLLLAAWQLRKKIPTANVAYFFCLMLLSIGLIKVSFLFLAVPIVIIVLFRFQRWRSLSTFFITVGLGVGSLFIYARLHLVEHQASFRTLTQLIEIWLNPWHWVWLLNTSMYSLTALALLFQRQQSSSRKISWHMMMLGLLLIIGCLPDILLDSPGGNGHYFSDVQKWLALAYITALLPYKKLTQPHLLLFGTTSFLLVMFMLNVASSGSYFFQQVQQRRQRAQAVIGSLNLENPAIRSPSYEVWRKLHTLSKMSVKEKQSHQLMIQRNSDYWQLLNQCEANPLIAPAVTGIVLVEGLPDGGCNSSLYGYQVYRVQSEERENRRTTLYLDNIP